MTIRLTLDLPATAADLVTYAELAAEISPDLHIEMTADWTLAATIGERQAQPEPEPEPEPKKARKAAKRAPSKVLGTTKGSDRRGAPGGVRAAVLHVLELNGGRFEGTAAELARLAHPSNPASGAQVVKVMLKKGELDATYEGRRAVAISTPQATTPPRHLEPVADPKPEPSEAHPTARKPAAPLPVPAEGIRKPAGGWA